MHEEKSCNDIGAILVFAIYSKGFQMNLYKLLHIGFQKIKTLFSLNENSTLKPKGFGNA